ncbi:MAG: beta-galactosidase trimerization domain-containing protein [Coriobacteriia bacterium]|nr:beta-galactosidase trimerization domain-containing protein [Coriobacteriia bacterium]
MRRVPAVLLACVVFSLFICTASAALATPITIARDGYNPPPIRVAVVHSQTTLDWLNYRGTPSRYVHASKEAAVLSYLKGRGYDVTEIQGDRDLLNSDNLKQYDVIVMPSMYALGKKASESVARYVAAGGGLVSTMSSPRVDPAHAPRRGVKDHMNEWWWNVMKSNAWEWGPLSSVYQAKFVNDGTYTPVFTLKPNPNCSIIASASAILQARGLNGSIAGITIHRDPGVSIEMAQPIKPGVDSQSIADFNILTPSIKRLYGGTYTAALATKYAAGRSVKFYFEIIDYLQNYNTNNYTPLTPSGIHQGEAAGAYLEASILWASSLDNTATARSIDATTHASVSAGSKRVTVRQTVQSTGNAITQGTARFAIYSPSGRLVKSWSKKTSLIRPGQKFTYSFSYPHKLGGGTYSLVAAFDYGYPIATRRASTQAHISRGHSATTQ